MLSCRTGSAGLLLVSVVLAVTGAAGCAQRAVELNTPQRLRRGLVLVLPGIEGRSRLNQDIAQGLDEGGVTSAVEISDWTSGLPGNYVYDLTNLERNRQEAAEIAAGIVAYRREHPGRPVHLIGHSAGGGVAVLTVEALPADQPVDAVILLAPALSPEYDLSSALRRVTQRVYNFYSEKDVTLLKIGTSVFGAVDREHGPAAGAVGFEVPADCDAAGRALYEARLRQVGWTPRLKTYGADGTHVGWATRQFARQYLAPIIADNEARRPVQWGLDE